MQIAPLSKRGSIFDRRNAMTSSWQHHGTSLRLRSVQILHRIVLHMPWPTRAHTENDGGRAEPRWEGFENNLIKREAVVVVVLWRRRTQDAIKTRTARAQNNSANATPSLPSEASEVKGEEEGNSNSQQCGRGY
uniref:Uncharacterized protein n=1 Tax=Anopheles coluzzii TaxID=1518534 RepID=A0A8W7P5W3_ANOCL